jgi:hypothetical protein
MLNEGGLLNGRIPSTSAHRPAYYIPRMPGGLIAAVKLAGPRSYLPREVFFFGLGLAVAPVLLVAAASRFCFFVAI